MEPGKEAVHRVRNSFFLFFLPSLLEVQLMHNGVAPFYLRCDRCATGFHLRQSSIIITTSETADATKNNDGNNNNNDNDHNIRIQLKKKWKKEKKKNIMIEAGPRCAASQVRITLRTSLPALGELM